MAQSINLVPREEKVEQVKVRVVKASTVVAVLLTIVVVGVSIYLFYTTSQLKSQIKSHEANITQLRGEIKDLSDIEVVARNMDKKYRSLDTIISSRIHFSELLEELRKRTPESVVIESYSMRGMESVSLNGAGSTYISVSQFLSNLGDPSAEVATDGLEKLFSEVSLRSVDLDKRNNGANFAITLIVNADLLREEISQKGL